MKFPHLIAGLLLVANASSADAGRKGITEADRKIDQFCKIQSDGSSSKFDECKKDNVVAMVALQIISEKADEANKEKINSCVERHYYKQGMINWEDAWECAKRR